MNEHSLVVLSDDVNRPRLDIFDTKQGITTEPSRTSFLLPAMGRSWDFISEPGGHTPSPDELITAPFYSDPSQRIVALRHRAHNACYVINAELLLELAREQEGQDVQWKDWVAYTIEVRIGVGSLDHIWVSGCRLYCITSDAAELSYLRIYDLSRAGLAKHCSTLNRAGESRGAKQISPSLGGYKLPWHRDRFRYPAPTKGHDSIVFCIVSILISLFSGSQLDDAFPSISLSRTRIYQPLLRKEFCTSGVFEGGVWDYMAKFGENDRKQILSLSICTRNKYLYRKQGIHKQAGYDTRSRVGIRPIQERVNDQHGSPLLPLHRVNGKQPHGGDKCLLAVNRCRVATGWQNPSY